MTDKELARELSQRAGLGDEFTWTEQERKGWIDLARHVKKLIRDARIEELNSLPLSNKSNLHIYYIERIIQQLEDTQREER